MEEVMKKAALVVFAVILSAMFLISCGGDKSGDSVRKSESSNDGSAKIYKTDELSIELGNDWTVSRDGAHNSKYSIFAYLARNTGNIYDSFNQDHEQVGEISETTVDGMPAVTRLQKFRQNEVKMSRVWLIYDGKNIIALTVAASENIYDDNFARELISKTKILHKGNNVKLPVEGERVTDNTNKYKKPSSFPEEFVRSLNDVLVSDAVLTEENMNNAVKVVETIQKMSGSEEKDKNEIINNVAKEQGFSDFDDMMNKTLKPSILSATVLSMIEKNNSEAVKTILKALLGENKLSYADLKFTYDHWDEVMNLYNMIQKK
jgi:hypothetical protein